VVDDELSVAIEKSANTRHQNFSSSRHQTKIRKNLIESESLNADNFMRKNAQRVTRDAVQ
jgi:hypothetical protein